MSFHSQIKNNGPRKIGDVLKSIGLSEAQVREAREQVERKAREDGNAS